MSWQAFAGGAGAAGGADFLNWSGGAGGIDVGFADWLQGKYPEKAGGIMQQLGLLSNKGKGEDFRGMWQQGMTPPLQAMDMNQLQNMVRGQRQQVQVQPPQGSLWDFRQQRMGMPNSLWG